MTTTTAAAAAAAAATTTMTIAAAAVTEAEQEGGKKKATRGRRSERGRLREVLEERAAAYPISAEGEARLREVLERSQLACLRLWKPKPVRFEAWSKDRHFLRALRKEQKRGPGSGPGSGGGGGGGNGASEEQNRPQNATGRHEAVAELEAHSWSDRSLTRVFRALYRWRIEAAELADESPYFVCPSDLLVDIACRPPANAEGLLLIAMPLPPLLGDGTTRYAQLLLKAVASALEEESEGSGP